MMTPFQTLSLDAVKKAAAEAYRNKKLTAQHPKRAQRQCVYKVGDYRCAVGAALTPETIAALDKTPWACGDSCLAVSFNYCNDKGYLAAEDEAQEDGIDEIQRAHDAWCGTSQREGARHHEAKKAERRFRELIGISA